MANVTRADVQEFLQLAAEVSIRPEIQLIPLKMPIRHYWNSKMENPRRQSPRIKGHE